MFSKTVSILALIGAVSTVLTGTEKWTSTTTTNAPTANIAVMSVEPETIWADQQGIDSGDTFRDSICITNVTDLFTWGLELGFNPDVLHGVSFEEGPFLKGCPSGQTIFMSGAFDNESGNLSLTACTCVGSVGVNGNGTVLYITWKVVGCGSSILHLHDAELYDSNTQGMPFDAVDGYFYLPPVGIEENSKFKIQNAKLLLQNYPNPFSPDKVGIISYSLPVASKVSLKIYDISGRWVKTLVDEVKESGVYTTDWDTKGVPESIYFLRLDTQDKTVTKKIVIVSETSDYKGKL